jgi:DNA-3-methyladenine glycosylase
MAAREAPALPPQGPVRLGRRLPRAFYARPAPEVAPELLGRVLVRRLPGGVSLAARIVETEAYMEDDPASHSFRGPTPRNEVMFGRPGHLYVYFTYGMHFCMNVVTGGDGEGSAVLLRAGEPLEGLEEMACRRRTTDIRRLCSGPARWTEAFGIAREENGADLVRGDGVDLVEGEAVPGERILRTTRVGVKVGADRRWRYLVKGDPFVSPGRPAGG